MSDFKALIQQDNSIVFMNDDEFSDQHVVNGKRMSVIIDNLENIDREKRYMGNRSLYADGLYLKDLLIYVKAEDFGPLPSIGRTIALDGKSYVVTDAVNEDGIYSISMEANKTVV